MAISVVGTVTCSDATSTTSRNTSNLPAGTVTDDFIYLEVGAGANTWFHAVTSSGVTWSLEGYNNSVAGELSSVWRGRVNNGAVAASQPITITVNDGTTNQATKVSAVGVVLRGVNPNAPTNRYAAAVVATAGATYVSPVTAATTVANCITLSFAHFARGSTVPNITTFTYDGAATDAFGSTGGTTSLHAAGLKVGATPLSTGATAGGGTWTADQGASPKAAFTLAIAPIADPLPMAAVVNSSGWSLLGGGSFLANVSDNNASTGAITTGAPTNLPISFTMPGIEIPVSDLVIACEGYKISATTGSIVGTLYEGATLRATSDTITPGNSNAPFNLTFPLAGLSGVTSTAWAAGLTLVLTVSAA